MNIKRFTLRTKLIFSTFLMRHNAHEEKGFIYEFDDVEELKKNKLKESSKFPLSQKN